MKPNPLPVGEATSDEELASRVASGEIDLFEILMRRHNGRMYRAVRSFIRDEAEAEDAIQQAYVSAYTSLGQFQGNAKFSTWLTRIAINEALGRLRRQHKFVLVDDETLIGAPAMSPSETTSPEDAAAGREWASILERAIDAIPDSYRSAFMLREVEGLSTQEAAEVLSVSEDVVKTRLHRAKGLLREQILSMAHARLDGVFPFHAQRCNRIVSTVMARIKA
jgi:RNA polymerase sigma-70 factor, ECF subfamily